MSRPSKANGGDLIDFKWGNKKGIGVKNKDVQFYESFVYDGVEYSLYDCVYFYHTDHVETSIGKLVKMFERPTHEKLVKVVWFLRPREVRDFLGKYQPRWNELFLASGVGKGVSNVNFLESIIGKCSVVCTSKDSRNPQPSEKELKSGDFFFRCTFDVGNHVIVDKFGDEIDGVNVEQFFNKRGDKRTSNHQHVETNTRDKIVIKPRTNPSDISRHQVKDKAHHQVKDKAHHQVKDKAEVRTHENVLPERPLHTFPFKKRKIVEEKSTISQSSKSPKEDEFNEKKTEPKQDKSVKPNSKVIEVTERPDAPQVSLLQERRRWFKKLPWDERLQIAEESDTLVLLSNLDPSFTSYEVEDLVWRALKQKVEARMIAWSPTSNTYYGRAFVIFKTKVAAESAISELNKRCLVLGDGRVVSAMKGTLNKPSKQNKFPGHLVIEGAAPQMQRQEMRDAVSTSHCSQPNTIEYDMAKEWRLQCEKFDACLNALHKRQMKEIQDVKSKLQMKRIFSKSHR